MIFFVAEIFAVIVGKALAWSFYILPKYVIVGYKKSLEWIETVVPITAKVIRVLVIEFVIFEAIFQLAPEMTTYDLASNGYFSGTYEYVISHQWNKEVCDRMGKYLADNAVDDFTSLPEPIIVPAMVLIPSGVVVGLIGVALYLNWKYIVVSIIVDVVKYIIRRTILF